MRLLYQTQDQHQQKRSDSPLYVFCPDCIMSQDAPAQLQRALELIDAEYKSVPSGEQMSSKLKDKFASTFANPPIKELEYLLQSAGCNLEDADGDMVTSLELETVRALLFQPSHAQMRLYPSLLRKLSHIESDTEASEASKFQPLLWAFVYLVHRKSWEFLETFILSGGLLVVSSMLSDENLYCRGQAVDIMLSITDSDLHEWFKRPEDSTTRQLHSRMLCLYRHQHFLTGLIGNRKHSYPGGSMRCLQILAFWLSWIRAEYSEDQKLVLSNSFLFEFRDWTVREVEGTELLEKEKSLETELAETLLKDFGGFEAVEDFRDKRDEAELKLEIIGFSTEANELMREGVTQMKELEAMWESEGARRGAESQSHEALYKMKDNANLMYKNKRYTEALAVYEQALELLPNIKDSADFCSDQKKEMEATLHFNRASSLWKLSQQSGSTIATSSGDSALKSTQEDDIDDIEIDSSLSDKIFELQLCEQACEAALAANPRHLKAFFRLVCTILALGRPQEALARVDEFEQTLDSDVDSTKTVAELRRKCNASLIIRAGPLDSTDPDAIASFILSSGAQIKPSTAKLMARLNLRRKRENESCTHAWRGWEPPVGETDKTAMESGVDVDGGDEEVGHTSFPIDSILQSMGISDTAGVNEDATPRSMQNVEYRGSGTEDTDAMDPNIYTKSRINVGIPFADVSKKESKSEKKKGSKQSAQEDATKAKEKAKAKKSDFMKMFKAL